MFPLTRGSYGLIGCPWCYDFLGTKLRFGSYTVDGIPQNTPKIASTKKSEKKNKKPPRRPSTLPHFRPISLLWVWSFFSHLGLSIAGDRHSRPKKFPIIPPLKKVNRSLVACELGHLIRLIYITNIIDGKSTPVACFVLGLIKSGRLRKQI